MPHVVPFQRCAAAPNTADCEADIGQPEHGDNHSLAFLPRATAHTPWQGVLHLARTAVAPIRSIVGRARWRMKQSSIIT